MGLRRHDKSIQWVNLENVKLIKTSAKSHVQGNSA